MGKLQCHSGVLLLKKSPIAGPAQRLLGGVNGVWWGSAIVLILLWTAFVAMAFQERRKVEAHQLNEVTLQAAGLSEYVSLSLLSVDRLIVETRESWRDGTGLLANSHLASELTSIPRFLLWVAVLNERGTIVASTTAARGTAPIADPETMSFLARSHTDHLLFTPPLFDPVFDRVSLRLVRPLWSAQGDFRGAVVASVDPQVLRGGAQDPSRDGASATIVGRNDGIVRVRVTPKAVTWGETVASSPLWRTIASQVSGSVVARGVLDKQERTFGFHQIGAYPLAIVISEPVETLWDVGVGRMNLALLMAIAFTVALLVAACARARLEVEQEENFRILSASRQRELEANRMKSTFLASVSHELRTPLNSILGFSELIRDDSNAPETSRYASLIHDSGKHLHALVNTLLDLAKIEAGKMDVDLTDVDLRELLAQIAETHRVCATSKGLTLALGLPAGGKIVAHSDRTKLIEVLNNILHNAIKFTHSGEISVVGSFASGGFLIRVIDSGRGISKEDLKRVFERFNTAAATPSQEKGSGLGLALSKSLIELLGGSLTIRSQPGAGTQVDIYLPRVTEVAA